MHKKTGVSPPICAGKAISYSWMGGLAPASRSRSSTADLVQDEALLSAQGRGRMNRQSFAVGLKAIGLCKFRATAECSFPWGDKLRYPQGKK